MSKSIPMRPVIEATFETWLAGQSDTLQAWLKATGFTAASGTYVLVPGSDGGVEQLFFGQKNEADFWALGKLGKVLPAGEYHVDAPSWTPTEMQRAALAWRLGQYRFSRYVTDKKNYANWALPKGIDVSDELAAITLVRDLINTPAEDLGPVAFAAEVEAIAKRYAAVCACTVGEDLLSSGLTAIHAVGRASSEAPRLVDLRWGDPAHPALTLVGKGVCFDSGGLDIKNASGMRFMKKDMGGAATALGLAQWIMASNLPVRLRLLLPIVENAIAGNSLRPGDVIPTKAGLTVEVGNTDAEGRLILADALALAMADKPDHVIDFSTLTGAARIAMGPDLPAFFCNDACFATGLFEASKAVLDPIWELPLYQPYQDLLRSDIADLHNISSTPYGGAITAALFLERFVDPNVPWAHFDSMSWNTRHLPGRPKGGEAMAMRAVYHWVATQH